METFNVIIYDGNNKFTPYDILPYLKERWKEVSKKPKTFKEFKEFILKASRYQFWARCEYEILLNNWPCQDHVEKWDVYDQIKMNINVITKILRKCVMN